MVTADAKLFFHPSVRYAYAKSLQADQRFNQLAFEAWGNAHVHQVAPPHGQKVYALLPIRLNCQSSATTRHYVDVYRVDWYDQLCAHLMATYGQKTGTKTAIALVAPDGRDLKQLNLSTLARLGAISIQGATLSNTTTAPSDPYLPWPVTPLYHQQQYTWLANWHTNVTSDVTRAAVAVVGQARDWETAKSVLRSNFRMRVYDIVTSAPLVCKSSDNHVVNITNFLRLYQGANADVDRLEDSLTEIFVAGALRAVKTHTKTLRATIQSRATDIKRLLGLQAQQQHCDSSEPPLFNDGLSDSEEEEELLAMMGDKETEGKMLENGVLVSTHTSQAGSQVTSDDMFAQCTEALHDSLHTDALLKSGVTSIIEGNSAERMRGTTTKVTPTGIGAIQDHYTSQTLVAPEGMPPLALLPVTAIATAHKKDPAEGSGSTNQSEFSSMASSMPALTPLTAGGSITAASSSKSINNTATKKQPLACTPTSISKDMPVLLPIVEDTSLPASATKISHTIDKPTTHNLPMPTLEPICTTTTARDAKCLSTAATATNIQALQFSSAAAINGAVVNHRPSYGAYVAMKESSAWKTPKYPPTARTVVVLAPEVHFNRQAQRTAQTKNYDDFLHVATFTAVPHTTNGTWRLTNAATGVQLQWSSNTQQLSALEGVNHEWKQGKAQLLAADATTPLLLVQNNSYTALGAHAF